MFSGWWNCLEVKAGMFLQTRSDLYIENITCLRAYKNFFFECLRTLVSPSVHVISLYTNNNKIYIAFV